MIRATGGVITHELFANSTLDFGLVPICYGTVEGYVTDEETGAPLPEALIRLIPRVETDANGFYRIEQVQLGENNAPIEEYRVRASKTGYWEAEKHGTAMCDQVTRVDLELLRVRPAAVVGVVVEGTPDPDDPNLVHPTSIPIEGATVHTPASAPSGASDESAADGTFRLDLDRLFPRNAAWPDASLVAFADGYWTRPATAAAAGPRRFRSGRLLPAT